MSNRIVITGGTGFIGTALSRSLTDTGYEVVVLSRKPKQHDLTGHGSIRIVDWDGCTVGDWVQEMEGAFGVINLAGENLATGRWSEEKKRRILESRTNAAQVLVRSIRQISNKPQVLIQASAIGFYGDRGDELLDESANAGGGFLADIARQWEASVQNMLSLGVRSVIVRIGVVLGDTGGMLMRILPFFRKCLGGPWGNGRQWLSWVHLSDVIGAMKFLLEKSDLKGSFNLSSPTPVQVKEFCRVLAEVLDRPAVFRVPALVLRLALGDMARELLLTGQRVMPKRLLEAGYEFQFALLSTALQDLTNRPEQVHKVDG